MLSDILDKYIMSYSIHIMVYYTSIKRMNHLNYMFNVIPTRNFIGITVSERSHIKRLYSS